MCTLSGQTVFFRVCRSAVAAREARAGVSHGEVLGPPVRLAWASVVLWGLVCGCFYTSATSANHAYDPDGDGVDMFSDCDNSDVNRGGPTTWYADQDGDGFGDLVASQQACAQPDGYVANPDDCDDGDVAIHPDADERCDEQDNDCDGTIDQGASDIGTWYRDSDGDGFGVGGDTAQACEAPAGYTDNADDCDDGDGSVFPGAEGDNDCGGTSPSELSLSDAQGIFWGEVEDDDAGHSVAAVGDMDEDGYGDFLVGAPQDQGQGSGTGAAYLVFGPQTGEAYLYDVGLKISGQSAYDEAGSSLSSAGDMDGDGKLDILIGIPKDDSTGWYTGAAAWLRGPITASLSLSQADITWVGEGSMDKAGACVSWAGDVDGDGLDDLLVGAPTENNAGAAYLLLGRVWSEAVGTYELVDADAKLTAEGGYDYAGTRLHGGGDVNGDGFADILVGAHYNDGSCFMSGAGYLLFGPVSGTLGLASADAIYQGEDENFQAGSDVAFVEDTNDDGIDDILIGSKCAETAGKAYLVVDITTGVNSLSHAEAILVGNEDFSDAGSSVAGAGDVDQDGFADILIGAYNETISVRAEGGAYLFKGPVSGTRYLSAADLLLKGSYGDAEAGFCVSSAGDVDGDDYPDILVGSPGREASTAGAAYLLLGGGFR